MPVKYCVPLILAEIAACDVINFIHNALILLPIAGVFYISV